MRSLSVVLLAAAPVVLLALGKIQEISPHKGHHHHHGHHHKKNAVAAKSSQNATALKQSLPVIASNTSAANLLNEMKRLETDLTVKTKQEMTTRRGELEVNGPLPADFSDRFAKEVAKATGCKPEDVRVLNTTVVEGHVGVDEIVFEAPPDVIKAVQEQAADPDSKLATGPLRVFLIEKSEDADADAQSSEAGDEKKAAEGKESAELADDADAKLVKKEKKSKEGDESEAEAPDQSKSADDAKDDSKEADSDEDKKEEAKEKDGEEDDESTPVQEKGIDIDTSMPYGELEPFGREDTAQELTKGSIRQSDEMVDQLERAEVAEEKRAVFRALTRLRGAAITSFDGVARSQTGNIDAYARTNHWRSTHPVRHLADEESDVQKWAFPENSDF